MVSAGGTAEDAPRVLAGSHGRSAVFHRPGHRYSRRRHDLCHAEIPQEQGGGGFLPQPPDRQEETLLNAYARGISDGACPADPDDRRINRHPRRERRYEPDGLRYGCQALLRFGALLARLLRARSGRRNDQRRHGCPPRADRCRGVPAPGDIFPRRLLSRGLEREYVVRMVPERSDALSPLTGDQILHRGQDRHRVRRRAPCRRRGSHCQRVLHL